jgi:amino acid transporter
VIEYILLLSFTVLLFLVFVATTIAAVTLIVYRWRGKAINPDLLRSRDSIESRIAFNQSLIIMPLLMIGVIWFLLITDFFRIPMVMALLTLIQILVFMCLVRRLGRIPEEGK